MYLGEVGIKELVCVGLMIIFTMAAMFFMGYRYSYGKAIKYANNQLSKLTEEFQNRQATMKGEDFILYEPLEIMDLEAENNG